MELRIVRADPAGNITLFVLDPVERSQRPALAERLMAIDALKAEQVGFACPAGEGVDGVMEMAAGEFCGNATRSYAMLIARERGLTGRVELLLRVSGCAGTVRAEVDTEAGTAFSQMPLPVSVTPTEVLGRKCTLVDLGGIAHMVAPGCEHSEEFFLGAENQLKACPEAQAYGVMYLTEGSVLRPLVKVPAVNSLVWEGSCGSGSLACALAKCADMPDGVYEESYVQPAGTVTVRVRREAGRVTETFIGGSVSLSENITIELP